MTKISEYFEQDITQGSLEITKDFVNSLLNLLILTNKNVGQKFFHFSEIEPSIDMSEPNFVYTQLWNLIESKPSTLGFNFEDRFYRISDLGFMFIKGEISISKYLFVEGLFKTGASDEQVKISEILGVNFNYKEFLKG